MDLEQLVFNIYKDTNLCGKKFKAELIRKYKLKNTQISNIRAKITKYQNEKYGGTLGLDTGYKTQEECRHLSVLNNIRRQKRRKG